MGSASVGKYVVPGLETAIGAGSQFFAPGNPVGLGLMGAGAGQLAGGAAGGSQGQALGGALGGLGGSAWGAGGMPGMSGLQGLFGMGKSPADAAGLPSSGDWANFMKGGAAINSNAPKPPPQAGAGLQALMQGFPQLVGMFGGGQQSQQQQPQVAPLQHMPVQQQPMAAMGPQQMSVPSGSPNMGQHNSDTTGLLALLQKFGMLNA